MDELLDSDASFLTGNTDTVYCGGFLDLERDGPTVVEIPPGCGPGTVNDAWFRFVIDMGGPGPDRGQGGKYLILPPGHDGDVPDGYFVATSSSYSNWLILRGFLVDGKPDEMIDPETRGLLSAIGIHKDHPFAPDERMRKILVDAAAVGNATACALHFRWRDDNARIYDDRTWPTYFIATVNTPAMALELVGLGSQDAGTDVDADGSFLDGSKRYRLRLRAGVPARNFWSICVYDTQTRSELQTSQPIPSLNNVRHALQANDDGSIDIVFGPEEPAELATNWIQTVPGKGWFAALRLYGPLEPWFDKTWRPGDVEPVA